MTCGHCVASVTEEISELPGVESVDVDLGPGAVTVTSSQPLEQPAVRAAVEEAGYAAGVMGTPARLALFAAGLVARLRRGWGVGRLAADRVGPVEVATDASAGDDGHAEEAAAGDERTVHASGTASAAASPAASRSASPATRLDLRRDGARAGPHDAALRDHRSGRRAGDGVRRASTSRSCTSSSCAATSSGFQHVHPSARRRRHLDAPTSTLDARQRGGSSPTSRPPAATGADARRRPRPSPATYAPAAARGRRATADVDGYDRAPSTATWPPDGSALAFTRQPRRPAGHRPRALPRRLRPPRGAARRATSPTSTSTPEDEATPDPRSPSPPRCPSAGGYRLFLDFQHDGVVRTADLHRRDRRRTPRRPGRRTMATDVELAIGGMTCASCATRIERKLNKLDGVTATVNYATEKARVSYAGDGHDRRPRRHGRGRRLHRGRLPRRRRQAEPAPERPDGTRACATGSSSRAVLDRPGGRAGDGAGAAVRQLAVARRSTLAAPVVVWGAWPFHRAAWANLRHGAATMDTLISRRHARRVRLVALRAVLRRRRRAGHDARRSS